MKQMTEAQLLELAIRLYNEGFESGQDSAHNATSFDEIDTEARDDLIDLIISEV